MKSKKKKPNPYHKKENYPHSEFAKALCQSTFITSAANLKGCPDDTGREIVFAGRSNAGKSSTLNAISNQKALAKVSRQPGRTQLLNFFEINESLRLVDLPGYGYAKVAQAVKLKWQASIEEYLAKRESLAAIVILTDIRHAPNPFDEMLINWCDHFGIPSLLVLNKADKLSRNQAMQIKLNTDKIIQAMYEKNPEVYHPSMIFSASKKQGLEQLVNTIEKVISKE